MGKKRAVVLGIDEVEKTQKEKTKKRQDIKKTAKKSDKVISKLEKKEVINEVPNKKEEKKPDFAKKSVKNKPISKTHGKQYSSLNKKIDKTKFYKVIDAIKLLKANKTTKFDASVEVHINTLETGVKGEVFLPHGTGKKLRIAVFSPEVEEKIKANNLDFDILLALTPDMKSLVKYAKVLGPKGLMPSPKKGTLVSNISDAKKKFEAGNLNFKTEPKFPLIHQIVGKISFTETQLVENINTFLKAVQKKNMTAAFVKSTMSPALKLDISEL